MAKINLAGRALHLPESVLLRRLIGFALVIGGMLGFLPVLGFWMIPLGLMVLSVDSPMVRRWRRRAEVRIVRWWRSRRGA